MNGILVASGQTMMVDLLIDYFDGLGGVYVGLMTNQTVNESNQIGNGLTEITGVGYSRQLSNPWTKIQTGVDPIAEGYRVIFEVPVGETWADVNGYFVSKTLSGDDVLWAEMFPTSEQGERTEGDIWTIVPRYEQRYYGE